jgi:hypothetical protein
MGQPEIGSRRREYFSSLGIYDKHSYEDAVVRRLLDAVDHIAERRFPLKLSRVAHEFLIDPTPRLAIGSQAGGITFDSESQRFVITLFQGSQEVAGTQTLDALTASKRLRFAYAHEVAHRFFFVQNGSIWTRAIQQVTAGLSLAARMRTIRVLNRLEEGMCNNIARRVLVPDHELVSTVAPSIIAELCQNRGQLFGLLDAVARQFGVSRDFLFVRLQRAVDAKMFPVDVPVAAFIFGYSRGSVSDKSAWKLRVRVPLLPLKADGRPLKRLYPGIDITVLGPAIANFVSDALEGDREDGIVRIPIRLCEISGDGGHRGVKAELSGWWHILGQKSGREGRRVALWGRLRKWTTTTL